MQKAKNFAVKGSFVYSINPTHHAIILPIMGKWSDFKVLKFLKFKKHTFYNMYTTLNSQNNTESSKKNVRIFKTH